MATIIRMPEVLANATEAVISTWEVAEGTQVAVGDLLAEIETEKAVVEYTAEEAGILARYLAAPGERVEVGAPIALLLASADEEVDLAALLGGDADLASQAELPTDEPEVVADLTERAGAAGSSRSGRHSQPVQHAEPVQSTGTTRNAEPPEDEPTEDAPSSSAQTSDAAPSSGRVFASPLARRLAREEGAPLAELRGTGPGGRVVRRDVERWVSEKAERPAPEPSKVPAPAAAQASAQPPSATTAHEEVPLTPMRRAIARRLTESKSTVPHFYLVAECRVDRLLALRAEINAHLADASEDPVKVSVNDLVLKAAAAAYRAVPDANVQWGEDSVRRLHTVDIAVAVATDGGLLTPVVRGVDRLPVSELARSVVDLAGRARAGRLRQEELEGGSMSVSNLGMYGTREFSAILNPPQSLILAVGAAVQQPVVDDGALAVGSVMRCTVSADHRVVDGALAARWLAAFQSAVENPLSLLV